MDLSLSRVEKKPLSRSRPPSARLVFFSSFFFFEMLCPYLATNLQEVTESSVLSQLIVAVSACGEREREWGFERVPNAWRRMGARRDRRGRGTNATDRHKASARRRRGNKDAHKDADRRRQKAAKSSASVGSDCQNSNSKE